MARATRDVQSKLRRVAVVHDWLTGMRGGEAVLEAILELFPEADLYTLLHVPGSVSERIENRRIFTSFIDRLPLRASKYRWYLPLFPAAIERFDFHGYDLIISSSHCVARGVIPPPYTPHLCYFHSPMRYVWDMYHEYFPARGIVNRMVIPFFANYLRMWDVSAKDRVDAYVSNSGFVAERIRRYYGKQAAVIPPPCIPDREAIRVETQRDDYYLIVSAFVPYKRIDLAIEAFRRMPARRLVIVGGGPEEARLRKLAPDNVEFAGKVSREEIDHRYGQARALIFPGKEDFGIVPVEAQARGCPVIAYAAGGALETVLPGKTGETFAEQTPESLAAAVNALEERLHKKGYKADDFRKNAARFTTGEFQRKILAEIARIL